MGITLGGKPIAPKPASGSSSHYGKHIKLTSEQLERRANALNAIEAVTKADAPAPAQNASLENLPPRCAASLTQQPSVFAHRGAIEDMPVHERQRIVHDQGGYVDRWLGEIAVLAKDRQWLQEQVDDPQWFDHPGRPDAIKRLAALDDQIADIADSIAWGEAWGDRCWQTLSVEERKPVAYMWLTPPEHPRLVTRSWRDQAKFSATWPKGFRVQAKWFSNLPTELYTELTSLWIPEPTWLGEPVPLDDSKDREQNDELVREIRSRLS